MLLSSHFTVKMLLFKIRSSFLINPYIFIVYCWVDSADSKRSKKGHYFDKKKTFWSSKDMILPLELRNGRHVQNQTFL